MSEAINYALIEETRARMRSLEAPPAKRRRGAQFVVPNILCTSFDPVRDSFHVVFDDLLSVDVPRTALRDVGDRTVAAWGLDEFRRGVQIVLTDGELSSFSAEFARAHGDAEYRQWAQSRHSTDAELAHRVATRVQALRAERHWSVTDLARRAGMAAPNVHRVEASTHVPSTRTMLRLCTAFGVPLARLVELHERRRNPTISK